MINKVILMGRITRELEMKQTANSNSVLSFNVAVDRSYQKQGEEFDASAYVDSVMGGETDNVTASVPDGGLHPGVNQVTYSCINSMELTGTTTLYVIVE